MGVWEASEGPLGRRWALLARLFDVLGCLWGGFGGDRAGTLINRRFGVLCLAFLTRLGVCF